MFTSWRQRPVVHTCLVAVESCYLSVSSLHTCSASPSLALPSFKCSSAYQLLCCLQSLVTHYLHLCLFCCVSVQGLHPSEEHLKANYITRPHKGCPSSKAPPNAAHKCSFFSLFLEVALLLSLLASHVPRFFARPKKKNEREKMATSRSIDHHFCWQKS